MELTDEDWEDLIDQIKRGDCTPFLGAGASYPLLPMGNEVAERLGKLREIPERYRGTLSQAAQWIALHRMPTRPKADVQDLVKEKLADISDAHVKKHDPHSLLAEMPIKIYLTTNYDDLMERALRIHDREYKSDYCRWNQFLDPDTELLDPTSEYIPKKELPLVYHLHGIFDEHHSIVVSEADYVDFLVNIFRDQKLPNSIRGAISNTSLLFIGYSLEDISFRIIAKGILGSLPAMGKSLSVTVQLDRDDPEEREYLTRYVRMLGGETWRVYWGDAAKFSKELRQRWEAQR